MQLAAVGPVCIAIEGEGPAIPLELHAVSNHQIRLAPPTVGLMRASARLRAGARSVDLAGFASAARVEARSDDPAVLRLAWRWDGVKEGVGRTTLTWSAGTLVHGRVIESRTGVPVPGVRLRATTGNATTTVVTDEQGSYHLRCAPGRLSLNYASPPTARHLPGEFSPEHAHVAIPSDAGELALPDWVLLVDDPVRGRVVGEDGSPRAGVWGQREPARPGRVDVRVADHARPHGRRGAVRAARRQRRRGQRPDRGPPRRGPRPGHLRGGRRARRALVGVVGPLIEARAVTPARGAGRRART